MGMDVERPLMPEVLCSSRREQVGKVPTPCPFGSKSHSHGRQERAESGWYLYNLVVLCCKVNRTSQVGAEMRSLVQNSCLLLVQPRIPQFLLDNDTDDRSFVKSVTTFGPAAHQ